MGFQSRQLESIGSSTPGEVAIARLLSSSLGLLPLVGSRTWIATLFIVLGLLPLAGFGKHVFSLRGDGIIFSLPVNSARVSGDVFAWESLLSRAGAIRTVPVSGGIGVSACLYSS